MTRHFETANDAYEFYYNVIIDQGIEFGDTKALFNVGFYIDNPTWRVISNRDRKWSLEYAEAEWQWYLSGDNRVSRLGELYGKIPDIWNHMADTSGCVNSNYGWQWMRNDQLDYIVEKLKAEPDTRQAAISIYDAKEHASYEYDTPCTYAVQFSIINEELCMSVYMRSNDLWYGFCNDQYQFSQLQQLIASMLGISVGWYYHHAHNLHLYNNKIPNNGK